MDALNAGISDISKPSFTSGGFRYNNENTNSGMAIEIMATKMLSCFSFMNDFKRGQKKTIFINSKRLNDLKTMDS